MLASHGGNRSCTPRMSGAALFGLAAGALLLGACDYTLRGQRQQGHAAKLAAPESMTPPVRVAAVAGAPAHWQLHKHVAAALRERDIPAGVKLRGAHVYVLRGRVVQIDRVGARSMVTVKWRLQDGRGRDVGEVSQVAVVPHGQTGEGGSDDVNRAMADVAAESLSPIVPSSRLRTSRRAMTGLPGAGARRDRDSRKPVTAIGRDRKKQTRLSRNLLDLKKAGGDKTGAAAAVASGDAKTALGRGGMGKSRLSRNLLRGRPPAASPRVHTAAHKPAGKRKANTGNGDAGGKNRATGAAAKPLGAARKVAGNRRVYWIQVGSYGTRKLAEEHWQSVKRAGGVALKNVARRIMRVNIGNRGIFYRVQVGPYRNEVAAHLVCRVLRDRKISCFLYPDVQQAALSAPRTRKPVILPVTRAGGPGARPAGKPGSPGKPGQRAKRGEDVDKAAGSDTTKAKPAKAADRAGKKRKTSPDRDPISTSPGLPGLKD